ncbi:FHA domain-containing protein [Noviherbaspirillum massiliense]|uniref:FHA domain-containing protein n=1 Tax=Noviherbaspirillum massiliense TaxID=1465823 RepID=UPI0002D34B8F|nr:FHA domain-containing protein [Noviherbaspirillum massiliense]
MNVASPPVPDPALNGKGRAPGGQESEILLEPLSHPELGEIRIEESLFAVGRTEHPFASWQPDLVADLSRRHARIFSQYGTVYLADLGSKNGTTVNGVEVRQKTVQLHDGDEVCFGGRLLYRVRLGVRTRSPKPAAKLLGLTLQPERGDHGLQAIVVTQFPFLVGKADAAFSRYKEKYPQQVNYLSRRHAHVFLKGGAPYIEDLGSTNGTFLNGKRLDEHALPLQEGDVLGFGGHHFVYRLSLQQEDAPADPTLTRLGVPQRPAAVGTADADKTTFVAAADSFLDIFCVDPAPQQEDEVNEEAARQAGGVAEAGQRRPRGKFAAFLSELRAVLGEGERRSRRRAWWAGGGFVVILGALAFAFYLKAAPERELQDMLDRGEAAQAAASADHYLEQAPDDAQLQALGTEALLKAKLPQWLAHLKAREFDAANADLAHLQRLGSHNADARPLLGELAWMTELERFMAGREGTDAPIRIFADEDRISAFLKRWNEDTREHQRMFSRIASYVPEFRDSYAGTLSHLRRLQSDDAVYVAAIDRLKTTIRSELDRDRPEALEDVLKDYAEKYPRLAGLDSLRQDLRQYLEIDRAMRARTLVPLIRLLAATRLATPPFQAKLQSLIASRQLPSADMVAQYQTVSRDWRAGRGEQALAGLERMDAGTWRDAVAQQLEHKRAVLQQFAQLQKARGTKGYDDRLLAFYASLDPQEDAYFVRATEADVNAYRGKALKRAQDLLARAQTLWSRYRENGAIGGGQRLEAGISGQFRTQARLLSEAQDNAQQGMRIYTQLKADYPVQSGKLRDDINAETELQRRSLLELRRVLEPGLLKAKLDLLGGPSDEERRSSKTPN